jgi:ribosome production factor 2
LAAAYPSTTAALLQEEDAKNILILQGTKVSQVVKDVLLDINKLKKLESVRYTRANEVRPFEAGGEASLQFFCQRSDCTLFCLGQHSKKRPHNLVLGRMFDNQVLDMLEFGVVKHTPITQCSGSSAVAMGNQVRMHCPSACW